MKSKFAKAYKMAFIKNISEFVEILCDKTSQFPKNLI